MTAFYPPVDAKNLVPFRTIKALLEKDAQYLDAPECPYDPETKGFIRKMMSGFGLAGDVDQISLETADDLEAQLGQIYSNLVAHKTNDTSDKIQWAKAVTGIIDRIVTLRERVSNLKNFSDFQRRVVDLLEQVLTPAQRSDFRDRLGKYLNK